jgi:transcriptional regulator with XRE-family HTH domain
MNEEKKSSLVSVHHGKNIKRLREILGIKQEVLAMELNVTQQAISDLEKRANISDDVLERVSKTLNVLISVIKNFDETAMVDIMSSPFTNILHNSASPTNYNLIFGSIGRFLDLFESMLKIEQERNILLEKILMDKR